MMHMLGAVILASLVGSVHCAGMCGAFVTLAVASPDAAPVRPWKLQAAYHLGRLASYVSLGLLAGQLGASIDTGATLIGVQNLALTLSASLVAIFCIVKLLAFARLRVPTVRLPAGWQRLTERAHRAAWTLGPTPRAAAIGGLTTLLPCGWLYAFVALAMGSGGPFRAAMVMAAFWLGTVPILAALGAGARRLVGRPARYLPIATTALLLIVSVSTLVGRARLLGLLTPGAPVADVASAPICHPVGGLP